MKDIIVWAIHAPAGTLALVTAVAAMFAGKGSALHRKAGACFTLAMMIMLASGIVAACLKESTDDMMLGAVVMYTVFTAWLTARHRKTETGVLEAIALVWILGFAATAFVIAAGWREVGAPAAYLVWGGFAVLCALGDIRNLYHSGLAGIERIVRHVWRIGFSLVWAALAFTDKIVKMTGADIKSMPQDQLLFVVAVPTLLIVATIVYWIANLVFFSGKRFADCDGRPG